MVDEAALKNEIEKLGHEYGSKAKLRVYQVLTEVIKWIRISGHGSITLNAADHIFSEKIILIRR